MITDSRSQNICFVGTHFPIKGTVLRAFLLAAAKNLWPAYLLASVLILYGFGWGLPDTYHTRSFHDDENVGVWAVKQIHFPHFNPRFFNVGTGFFYQVYLVKLVFTVGGLLHATDYWLLVMGRAVVFASALGAITILFFLGRQIFDASTGRLAALILAVLPGFVINSHYFKSDVPLTFWILVTMLVAYYLLGTGNSKLIVLLGFLVGYTASVKPSGAVLFPVGCLVIAMTSGRPHKVSRWISYLVSVGIGLICGEPLVLFPRGWSYIAAGFRQVRFLNSIGVAYHVARPPAWIDYPLNVFPFSFSGPMLVAASVAFVWALVCQRTKFLPILAFLVLYYPLLAVDNWRLVRYTVPILPFAALFLAAFFTALRKRPVAGRVAVVVVSALIIYAFIFSLSYVRVMADIDPRIQASRWIVAHIPKDQPIPEVYLDPVQVPQLKLLGYKPASVGFSIPVLKKADSPYLVLSEAATSQYLQAIDYYPKVKDFLRFVADNYSEAGHFENSQRLLFVDSKKGTNLPEDWLHPNPRITILVRHTGGLSTP